MWLVHILEASWNILRESAAFILVGFFFAGVLHVVLARTHWADWLKGLGAKSVVLASAVGLPLPLCSCSVLPVAVSLRKQGASKGATLSFLISTPETSVQSVLLTYSLLGWVMAIVRPLAACFTALLAGITQNLVEKRWPEQASDANDAPGAKDDRNPAPDATDIAESHCKHTEHAQAAETKAKAMPQAEAAPSCCCSAKKTTAPALAPVPAPALAPQQKPDAPKSCCSGESSAEADERMSWRDGMRHAFVMIFDDVVGWMLLGVVAAAVIQVAVPGFIIAAVFGPPLQAMLVMLVIGVPMYVCAEGSTPIAAALITQGVSPGAALVFLLAGPATNIGAVGVLGKLLGRRTMVIYLVSIAIVSVLMGLGLDWFVGQRGINLSQRALSESFTPDWVKTVGAVVFVLLCFASIYRWQARRRQAA